ncbi:origin recognition complex subunit 1-like [Schistocerca gregaria]|uniref:origin recognition complex subunit 1-like n=1 Tax=Schistocerca gregaria TaxID=7010 RepID=UPI00211F1A81|nr:origin recognition complex subunit 1-like [Schistocerca gregaria]
MPFGTRATSGSWSARAAPARTEPKERAPTTNTPKRPLQARRNSRTAKPSSSLSSRSSKIANWTTTETLLPQRTTSLSPRISPTTNPHRKTSTTDTRAPQLKPLPLTSSSTTTTQHNTTRSPNLNPSTPQPPKTIKPRATSTPRTAMPICIQPTNNPPLARHPPQTTQPPRRPQPRRPPRAPSHPLHPPATLPGTCSDNQPASSPRRTSPKGAAPPTSLCAKFNQPPRSSKTNLSFRHPRHPPLPANRPRDPPPITWEHICSLKNPNFSPSDNGPLLCREHEYKLILTSLSQFMVPLNHSSDVVQGGILFVAGVPGTGKTATVARVIQKLQSQLHFNLIQINSMKLTNPKKIFGLLLQNLNLPERRAAPPSKPNSERAQVLLDTHYRNPHVAKPVTMLVLDELEMLLTRNQQILYTLFEWARIENSNFVFVGISNMMDLPERLHPKIQSRMGSDRILFHAYQPQQLETILRNLFSPYLHIFEDESVLSYLSKKAGASRGDVRHLFELCKHLLRTAESDASANQPRNALISKKHVDRVVCMMEQTPRTLALKTASYHEKLWCVSVLLDIAQRRKIKQQLLLQNDGKPHPHDRDALEEDSTHFEFTVKQYLALCKKYNIPSCTTMNLQQISHRMGQMQIFNLNWQDRTLQRQIYLNLDPEDVLSALCLDQRLKEIVNNEELNKHYDSTSKRLAKPSHEACASPSSARLCSAFEASAGASSATFSKSSTNSGISLVSASWPALCMR